MLIMTAGGTRIAMVMPTIIFPPVVMCFEELVDPEGECCRFVELALVLDVVFEPFELCRVVLAGMVPPGGSDAPVLPFPSARGVSVAPVPVFEGEELPVISGDEGLLVVSVVSGGEAFPEVSGGDDVWVVSGGDGSLLLGGGGTTELFPPLVGQHCTSFGPGQ